VLRFEEPDTAQEGHIASPYRRFTQAIAQANLAAIRS
jgi:hypothetical protein